jgi:PAS domain S-box-containing protein
MTLFQKSFEPVLLIKNERFIDFNESALKYLGYNSKKELLNIHPSEISPEFQSDGQSSKEKADKMMNLAEEKGFHQFYWEHRNKNGELLYVDVSLTLIEINGEKHFYTVWRDLKEKKQTEMELILAKQKAEESNRLKSAFLESISHEIRTPMNAIIGFSQLLNYEGNTAEEMAEFINFINKSGNSLLLIIDNILDVSTLKSGVLEVRETELKLNKLIDELREYFNFETSVKAVRLEVDNRLKDKELRIITDGSRLRKTLFQLLNNATKFTERGTVLLGCDKKGDMLEFFVKDTGVGINKKEIDYVFDVFRKGNPRGEKLYGGTGLGLSIAKASVESMGGKIWLESETGKGTSVFFKVPLRIVEEK